MKLRHDDDGDVQTLYNVIYDKYFLILPIRQGFGSESGFRLKS